MASEGAASGAPLPCQHTCKRIGSTFVIALLCDGPRRLQAQVEASSLNVSHLGAVVRPPPGLQDARVAAAAVPIALSKLREELVHDTVAPHDGCRFPPGMQRVLHAQACETLSRCRRFVGHMPSLMSPEETSLPNVTAFSAKRLSSLARGSVVSILSCWTSCETIVLCESKLG